MDILERILLAVLLMNLAANIRVDARGNCEVYHSNGTAISEDEWIYDVRPTEKLLDTAPVGTTFISFQINNVKSATLNTDYLVAEISGDTLEINVADGFKDIEKNLIIAATLYISMNFVCETDEAKLGIIINLEDSNNHPPEFDQTEYTYHMSMPITINSYLSACTDDIIVTDYDITNKGVIFELDPAGKQYFVPETVTSDQKVHRTRLKAIRAIQLSTKLEFNITAIDIPGDDDNNPSSSTSTVIITPNLQESALRPKFQSPLYTADISKDPDQLSIKMNVDEGYVDNLSFNLKDDSGIDLLNLFDVSAASDVVTLEWKAGVDKDNFLETPYALLILEAVNKENDFVGATVVHLTLPGSIPPTTTTSIPTTLEPCPTTIEPTTPTECPVCPTTTVPTTTACECTTATSCPTFDPSTMCPESSTVSKPTDPSGTVCPTFDPSTMCPETTTECPSSESSSKPSSTNPSTDPTGGENSDSTSSDSCSTVCPTFDPTTMCPTMETTSPTGESCVCSSPDVTYSSGGAEESSPTDPIQTSSGGTTESDSGSEQTGSSSSDPGGNTCPICPCESSTVTSENPGETSTPGGTGSASTDSSSTTDPGESSSSGSGSTSSGVTESSTDSNGCTCETTECPICSTEPTTCEPTGPGDSSSSSAGTPGPSDPTDETNQPTECPVCPVDPTTDPSAGTCSTTDCPECPTTCEPTSPGGNTCTPIDCSECPSTCEPTNPGESTCSPDQCPECPTTCEPTTSPPTVDLEFEKQSTSVILDYEEIGLINEINKVKGDHKGVRYSIEPLSDDPEGFVTIDPETAQLELIAYLRSGGYTYTIMARLGDANATATFGVSVTNGLLCDNTTVAFPNALYVVNVAEHAPSVLLEGLSNEGVNCKYSLDRTSTEYFTVEELSGQVSVVDVDRESPKFNGQANPTIKGTLTVECDNSTNRKSVEQPWKHATGQSNFASVVVQIPYEKKSMVIVAVIQDINDNAPVFSPSSVTVGYPDSDLSQQVLPNSLTTVQATDADIGSNALIQYSLDSDGDKQFVVHPSTGVIYPREGTFDYHDTSFKVIATDSGDLIEKQGEIVVNVRILSQDHLFVVSISGAMLEDTQTILESLSVETEYRVQALSSSVITNVERTLSRRTRAADDDEDDIENGNRNETQAVLTLVMYAFDGDKSVDFDDFMEKMSDITGVDKWKVKSVKAWEPSSDGRGGDADVSGWVAAVVSLVVILVLVIGGVGALYYFFIYRPRRNTSTGSYENLGSEVSSKDGGSNLAKPTILAEVNNYINDEDLAKPENNDDWIMKFSSPPITITGTQEYDDAISKPMAVYETVLPPSQDKLAEPVLEPARKRSFTIRGEYEDPDERRESNDYDIEQAATRKKSVVTFNDNVDTIEIERL